MQYTIDKNNSRVVIRLEGRLTFQENKPFHGLVREVFPEEGSDGNDFVFDLSGVDFIDSAGIGMLLIAKDRADKLGASVTLANAPEAARRIIDVARLDKVFNIEG